MNGHDRRIAFIVPFLVNGMGAGSGPSRSDFAAGSDRPILGRVRDRVSAASASGLVTGTRAVSSMGAPMALELACRRKYCREAQDAVAPEGAGGSE
jgi:hypothetical protein